MTKSQRRHGSGEGFDVLNHHSNKRSIPNRRLDPLYFREAVRQQDDLVQTFFQCEGDCVIPNLDSRHTGGGWADLVLAVWAVSAWRACTEQLVVRRACASCGRGEWSSSVLVLHADRGQVGEWSGRPCVRACG